MKSIFKKIISSILIFESKLVLKKYKPTVISVTGSVGKTSTKDAIFTVLSDIRHIRKSEKSFNSEIGLPLTILGCQNGWNNPFIWLKNIFIGLELIFLKTKYSECLVLEIGADHPGDISGLTSWLKSDIVVITKVSDIPVHVEFFNSPDDVFIEKFSLVKSLKKDGVLIISADDKRLMDASKEVKNRVMTFGIDNLANINASNIEFDINKGVSFKLNYENNSIPILLKNIIGNQQVYPIISAIAVGIVKNVSISRMIELISNHIPPRGRMNLIKGINGSIIIDDSYNSSPDALHEALMALSKARVSGKKIAVLGDMMELGKYSSEEHKKAGNLALSSCDLLLTLGPRAKLMSDKAFNFDSISDISAYLKDMISIADVILVKGSQSMRMERIVKNLLSEECNAKDLLVRQESEWLAKK